LLSSVEKLKIPVAPRDDGTSGDRVPDGACRSGLSSTLAPSASYTFNPSSGNTVTITFSAASVRYLRLTFTANTGWPAGQLSELQAYAG
jgi:hypothetical protein